MAQIRITDRAQRDLDRLYGFLANVDVEIAVRAMEAIDEVVIVAMRHQREKDYK